MTDTLKKICADKKKFVAKRKKQRSEQELLSLAKDVEAPRGFLRSLQEKIYQGDIALIAEIKKASPSKGLIRKNFNVESIAASYEDAGAACISVLTDEPYFKGKDEYLTQVRETVALPILRKDFILDPYQVIEARSIGADCILLIMAMLEGDQAEELEAVAREQGMDVLVEVHNAEEVERANKLFSPLVGINNRDLKTLDVDLSITEGLLPLIPKEYTVVCESGIHSHEDIKRMQSCGVQSFLVGEHLMKQEDIKSATEALLGKE